MFSARRALWGMFYQASPVRHVLLGELCEVCFIRRALWDVFITCVLSVAVCVRRVLSVESVWDVFYQASPVRHVLPGESCEACSIRRVCETCSIRRALWGMSCQTSSVRCVLSVEVCETCSFSRAQWDMFCQVRCVYWMCSIGGAL